MVAPANKCADRCWRSVKNVDPIFFDDFPEPIGFRPIRRAFVHDGCRAISERTIDDVAVTRDPADISRAPKDIFISNVEDVLCGRINSDQITACSVKDAFWFASGATRVEKIKRVLAVERHRWTVRVDILQLAMPPDVAAFFHVNLVSCATENNHALPRRAITECLINIFFQRYNSAAPICAVGCDHRDRAAIGNSIPNAVGAKSAEDY